MNEKLRACGILLSIVFALVMFSFLITGIVYISMYGYTVTISQYTEHNCTLTEGTVATYDDLEKCFGIYYIPLWKVSVPDFNSTIYSAATDTMNIQNTRSDAYKQMKKYQENVTIKCYCNINMENGNVYPNFRKNEGCQVLTYCFTDIETTKASIDNEYYYHLGNILGMIGGLALMTKVIIIFPFILCIFRERKNRKQYITI